MLKIAIAVLLVENGPKNHISDSLSSALKTNSRKKTLPKLNVII
jgi:hypothetical protein